MVVMVVSSTGRKRRTPDSRRASLIFIPERTRELTKSISTIESLTTIPVRATIP